jgi:mutator protein MutT
MNAPSTHFHFCPRCGRPAGPRSAEPRFECAACGFAYYFSPTVAAAAFIVREDGCVLIIRRAKEPAKGKLAIPGGFIDIGETAEEALWREVREEVNLELSRIEFLCSQPNEYHYKEVTYPVCDLFFVARVEANQEAKALDAVESLCWLAPAKVDPEEIAFPSMKQALQVFLSARGREPLA